MGESLEERTAKGKVGAEGFWLWLEPSDLWQIKDWDKQGLMPQVLRYHVIACHQLLLENLKLTPNATSLQGESIVISVSQVREATSARCPFSLGPLSFLFLRVVRGIITVTTNACGVIAICQVLPYPILCVLTDFILKIIPSCRGFPVMKTLLFSPIYKLGNWA